MGELFLSGGGNAELTREVNEYFIRKIDPEKPLLDIPLAGDPEFRPYDRCLDYVKSVFDPLGVSEIMMWTDLRGKTFDDIMQFSAVYISGGDPMCILKKFKDTAFDKVLTHYHEAGGTIYGQSAGANILGKIITVMDEKETVDLHGLNLVNGYSVWCHYQEKSDLKLYEYVDCFDTSIIAIPEGTAVYANPHKLSVLGLDEAYLFQKENKSRIEKV
ncbi:Type 1 glutamine amidotransferase-like domain-containing protein [Alkalihalobacillus sp. TS-13]|uniref:Type 1 glutamine amidotransferase-like domain-containing protein n=1 Tax=Alkalihalobacillus sp. TS-13 TaxID=2842455 RepID=UPI001C87D351|nr:Type 1 glutamine amidotransferase-like domain-containing protein [Alkalihalobacillus sp. TS-13]